jgi:hypothetical protein
MGRMDFENVKQEMNFIDYNVCSTFKEIKIKFDIVK